MPRVDCRSAVDQRLHFDMIRNQLLEFGHGLVDGQSLAIDDLVSAVQGGDSRRC